MWRGDGCEGARAARSMLVVSIDVRAYARCKGKRAGPEAEGELRRREARKWKWEGKGKDRD